MNKKKQDDFIKNTVNKSNYILEDTLLDVEAHVSDANNFKADDIVKNTKKAVMSKVPWLISIFLILIISIYFVFRFVSWNPETIFTSTIDKFFSSITNNISDNNYEISKGKMKLKIEADFEENKEFFDELSKTTFDIDYAIDTANNLLKLKVFTRYNDEDFVDFDVYDEKGDIYFYSSDIYDKYLKLDDKNNYKLINPKDVKVVLSALNQAIDKVTISQKIIGGKTALDLGDKSIGVYETKLVIDKKNYKEVSETFINALKSNTEFISSFGKILDISNSKVQKKLDKLLLKIESFLYENEKLEIKFYNDVKSKNFIKATVDGKLGSFVFSQNNNNYDFVLVDNKTNEKVVGNVSVNINEKKTNYKFDFNSSYYVGDNLDGSLNIKFDITINKASSFKKIDISNAVSYDDLSDIEKFDIYNKVSANEKLSKFIGSLTSDNVN